MYLTEIVKYCDIFDLFVLNSPDGGSRDNSKGEIMTLCDILIIVYDSRRKGTSYVLIIALWEPWQEQMK